MTDSIDYVNIDDSRGDYFWTQRQIDRIRSAYVDEFHGSLISGSTSAAGLLTRATATTVSSSYHSREYLASGSLDARRHGVEITTAQQWAAGTVKISAGTPGHIVRPLCFGAETTSVIDDDIYYEISVFDPVDFLLSDGAGYTYPIVTEGTNTAINYIMNGTIEPITIRSVASFFSTYAPIEAHSVKGAYGNGNENSVGASDQVLTVDYYAPGVTNSAVFLDANDSFGSLSGSTFVGVSIPYFSTAQNSHPPFEDSIKPRGVSPSSTYDAGIIAALTAMSASVADVYLNEKQRSATSGFVYDNVGPYGTDSIAFGGMLY